MLGQCVRRWTWCAPAFERTGDPTAGVRRDCCQWLLRFYITITLPCPLALDASRCVALGTRSLRALWMIVALELTIQGPVRPRTRVSFFGCWLLHRRSGRLASKQVGLPGQWSRSARLSVDLLVWHRKPIGEGKGSREGEQFAASHPKPNWSHSGPLHDSSLAAGRQKRKRVKGGEG